MKKWKPKKGQVDFTEARFAPVINCVLHHRGKILIVQRSERLNFYPGYWNGISGFLDDRKSLDEKVAEELGEELGLDPGSIASVRLGKIFHQEEKKYGKTWIVHPIKVVVRTAKIRLDWEALKFEWVKKSALKQYKLLPGFDRVIKNLPA